MAKAIGVKMVGEAYRNGFRMPGWGIVKLDNNTEVFVPENKVIGFNGCLDYADSLGHDTKEYRERLDRWVKTGA